MILYPDDPLGGNTCHRNHLEDHPTMEWLRTMVIVSPLSGTTFPFQMAERFGFKMRVILNTYVRPGMIIQVLTPFFNTSPFQRKIYGTYQFLFPSGFLTDPTEPSVCGRYAPVQPTLHSLHQPFEDVSPIKNGDLPASRVRFWVLGWSSKQPVFFCGTCHRDLWYRRSSN